MADSNNDPGVTGRDAPVTNRREDDYDRWPVATAISNVIEASIPDWSTRIGVYGRWGDGKTTVLQFLQQQQTRAGNIVVRFSPWGAKQEFVVWEEFARALKEALNQAGISALTKRATAKLHAKRFGKWISAFGRGAAKAADTKLGLPVASPVFEATSTLLGQLLDLTQQDIESLVREVGNRRVVVMIDDLDRTDPTVIPSLLLALRELLDLPRFVFVLAFDHSIVAGALAGYNKAWGKSGEAFLEKVIDFPVELPHPTRAQVRNLALRQFGVLDGFFPIAALEDVIDLLPENPRRLKLLSRLISALGPEAKRHNANELDWFSILIFNMIRMESEDFTRRFIRKVFEETDNAWILGAMAQTKGEDEATKQTTAILDEVLPLSAGDPRRARIRELVSAWRSKRGYQPSQTVLYQISFATSPHKITWGEFIPALKEWRLEKAPAIFEDFVSRQAKAHEATTASVCAELVQTVLLHYGGLLEQASNAITQDQHRELLDEARDTLALFRYIVFNGLAGVDGSELQTIDTWGRLLQTSLSWIHFRANAGEPELRRLEEDLLIDGCDTVKGRLPWFEGLKPWSDGRAGLDDRTDRLRRSLLRKLISKLWPAVIDECIRLFARSSGVAVIQGDKGNDGLAFAMLAPRSKLYSPENEPRLSAALQTAPADPVVHANAIDYLGALMAALKDHGRFCQRDERLQFIRDNQELMSSLWAAVIARPSQYRFLQSLREHRKSLLEGGIPEEKLTTPDWLDMQYQDPPVLGDGEDADDD